MFKSVVVVLTLPILNYLVLFYTSPTILPLARKHEATVTVVDSREELHQDLASALATHAECLDAFPLHHSCGHPLMNKKAANTTSLWLSPSAKFAIRKLDGLLKAKQSTFDCQDDDDLGLYEEFLSEKEDLRYMKAAVRSVKIGFRQPLQRKRTFFDHSEGLYIAALLHNNAKVFPFWAREVLKIILSVAPPNAPKQNRFGHVFVAIYESGSTDNTPRLLRHFDSILESLQIPRWIRATGDLPSRDEDRELYAALENNSLGSPTSSKSDRIGRLAVLRNVVLGPMLLGSATFDRVLYLNDVFFCAAGAKKLISNSKEHSADLVCSTDYTEKDAACKNCSDLQFYDIWVAHDQSGSRFANEPPFITGHAPSLTRLARQEPFPVFSCWNGMVVIKADLFQSEGLRFRTHAPYECGASECELFSRDMWAIGRRRILMVPSVMTAYVFRTFVAVNDRRNFRPLRKWEAQLRQDTRDVIDFSFEEPSVVTCCSLKTGQKIIDWWDDCFPETEWYHIHAALGSPPRGTNARNEQGERQPLWSVLTAKIPGRLLDGAETLGDVKDAVRRHFRCESSTGLSSEVNIADTVALSTLHFQQMKQAMIRLLSSPCEI